MISARKLPSLHSEQTVMSSQSPDMLQFRASQALDLSELEQRSSPNTGLSTRPSTFPSQAGEIILPSSSLQVLMLVATPTMIQALVGQ